MARRHTVAAFVENAGNDIRVALVALASPRRQCASRKGEPFDLAARHMQKRAVHSRGIRTLRECGYAGVFGVILALLLMLSTSACAADLVLADGGQTTVAIVLPAEASREEQTAAHWLAEVLKRVTGASFAIKLETADDLPANRLCVGDTKAARDAGIRAVDLPGEAWRVKRVGATLLLAGGRPRGTLYAVCEFLENEAGVLLLDPFAAHIPKTPRLLIGEVDRQGRPAFPARTLFTGFPYGYPADGHQTLPGFAVFNKNNISGSLDQGDYFRYVPSGVHTLGEFIPSKEFAATHPEYFAMDAAGKRITDDMGTPSAWTQPCPSNVDVRRIIIERAKRFLLTERETAKKEGRAPAQVLSVSQNDNTINFCKCPDCVKISEAEGSEAGLNLDFVNHVARELRAEFPDVIVQTEAYNFTLRAPGTIRPEPNVLVRFCDNYGFSDPTRPLADPKNERPMRLFQGWRDKKCKLGVWDYWRVFQQHPPGFFAPSCNLRAMRADIKMFRDSGVEQFTAEAEDLFGAGLVDDPTSADMQSFMPLRTWVGLKLLDNPDRDLNALIDRFCDGYYGPAARPMRRLVDLIENRQNAVATRVVDVSRQSWAAELCDRAFMRQAFAALDEAWQLTADTPPIRPRIARERIIFDSVFLWMQRHLEDGTIAADDKPTADDKRDIAWPKRETVVARHRADWKMYIATVFNAEGLKIAEPIIERGIELGEKLQSGDTQYVRVARQIDDASVTIDGELNEPFWKNAIPYRLLPRDPSDANKDRTEIRFAWSPEALYVAIDQPKENGATYWMIGAMEPSKKRIQQDVGFPQRHGTMPVAGYFYRYGESGMEAVAGRKANGQSAGTITEQRQTAEVRILWKDFDEVPQNDARYHVNVSSYNDPESKKLSYVLSPFLIGKSPTYDPQYFVPLELRAE